MFRTSVPTEAQIWELGEVHFAAMTGKPLLARGDILTSAVRSEELRIVRDQPPPRHAIIIGWPEDKDARMDVQNVLAAAATLVMRP